MPKLTMQSLSEELDALRAKLGELEEGLESRVESTMGPAMKVLKRLGNEAKTSIRIGKSKVTVTPEQRFRMIEQLAFMHSQQRSGHHPEQDWFQAETEVNKILEILGAEPQD